MRYMAITGEEHNTAKPMQVYFNFIGAFYILMHKILLSTITIIATHYFR